MFLLTGSGLPVIGVVCAALLPAAFVWWTGRALLRNVDDPVLPERLMAMRLRARVVLAFSWALVAVAASQHALWAVPFMIVARALAAFPLRKALQGETWNPLEYLSFFTRLVLAFYGFWLLLLWAPSLEGLFGGADWIVAIVVAAILVAWSNWYSAVAWWLLRALPVTEPNLKTALSQMAACADVPQPPIGVVPLGGGLLANAVALPSRRKARVLVSSTFVERFTQDEIVAICAHEIAHLEYYSGARLRREYLQTLALALVGALLEPAARVFVPAAQSWLFVAWVVIVVTWQAMRARSRQRNETASDLRAIALYGKPDALASALVKLHAMSRVPRRWDAKVERHATHPSLARRIQAIRDAAGRAAPVLEHHESFASGEKIVTFERDRLQWSADALSMQSVGYWRLTELRLDVNRSQAPRLVAVDRSGQRWTFVLDAADIPRMQHVLDVVDSQLGEAVAAPSVSFVAFRLMSLLTAIVAVTASQFAIFVPVVLALARPSAALAAGVASGAIATAIVAWRDALETGSDNLWPAATIALCGAALFALAWVGRKDEDPRPLSKPLAVLAVTSVLTWIALLLPGVSALRLHQSAHAWPAAIVLPVALGAALAWRRPGALRRAAPAVFLVAALIFMMGSRTYLESFSHDQFIARGPAVALHEFTGALQLEAPIAFSPSSVRLSPGGRSIALGSDDDDDGPRVFKVGPVSGPFESIDCDDAFFIDDRRLLTVNHGRNAVRLREVRLAPGLPAGQERRVELRGARVEFRASTGNWAAVGTAQNDEIVRLEGNVNGGALVERRWAASASPRRTTWVQPVTSTREHVLMRSTRYHGSPFGWRYYALVDMFTPSWTESEFWVLSAEGKRTIGTSGLTIDCRAFSANEAVSGCAAFDGTRTTLFSLDLSTGTLSPRATLHGSLVGTDNGGTSWVTGHLDDHPIVMGLDGAMAWSIPTESGGLILAVGASDAGVATVVQRRHERDSVLRVYSWPPR